MRPVQPDSLNTGVGQQALTNPMTIHRVTTGTVKLKFSQFRRSCLQWHPRRYPVTDRLLKFPLVRDIAAAQKQSANNCQLPLETTHVIKPTASAIQSGLSARTDGASRSSCPNDIQCQRTLVRMMGGFIIYLTPIAWTPERDEHEPKNVEHTESE